MKSSHIKARKHNLSLRTPIKIKFYFNRRKQHFFIANNKLQVDQFKSKIEANFNKSLFIEKSNTFKSQNNHKLSSNQLDTTMWSYLRIQLDLSLVSFGLRRSVI